MCYTEKCKRITKFEGPAPVCVQIDMLVRIGEWMNKLTDSASISLTALWFLIWGPMLGYLGPNPDASSNRRHITPYLPAWCGPLGYFLEVLRGLCRSAKPNNFRNGLQIAFRFCSSESIRIWKDSIRCFSSAFSCSGQSKGLKALLVNTLSKAILSFSG